MRANGPNLKGLSRTGLLVVFLAFSCLLGTSALAGQAQISQQGDVTIFAPSSDQANEPIDYINAKPLEREGADTDVHLRAEDDFRQQSASPVASPAGAGSPGFSPGGIGSGETSPVNLGAPKPSVGADSGGGVSPQDFGTSKLPFSTARADLYSENTNTVYPYRATGKLFFKEGTASFICTASLIKPGVVVTAGHCVADYGKSTFYSGWQFVPGYRDGVAPFGVWSVHYAIVLTNYLKGTDNCAQYGVVCPDDVALLVLNSQKGAFAGDFAGWYSYGWNGYGFINGATQITQLGYPGCLDNDLYMERNDSRGFTSSSNSNNTIIGSLMCAGSSGGPWLVNFGLPPVLTGTSFGSAAGYQTVVGVTSWGANNVSVKEQGAAPFTSGNIENLVNIVCGMTPGNCDVHP